MPSLARAIYVWRRDEELLWLGSCKKGPKPIEKKTGTRKVKGFREAKRRLDLPAARSCAWPSTVFEGSPEGVLSFPFGLKR